MEDRSAVIRATSHVGSKARRFVEGWRDQECPVCGERWFVNATQHIVKNHDMTRADVHAQWGPLASEAGRQAPWLNEAGGGYVGWRQRTMGDRRRRWLEAIKEERASGPYYLRRLAARWRVSYAVAQSRVFSFVEEGAIEAWDGEPRAECRRGHPFDGENTYINPTSGRRFCKACLNLARQRYIDKRRR